MSLIAFVTDQVAIGKILGHLGLSTPEAEKPPPPAPKILRVVSTMTVGACPGGVGVSLRSPHLRAVRSATPRQFGIVCPRLAGRNRGGLC
jgi:hypothetical protein